MTTDNELISIFIDDSSGGEMQSVWYDGVGYSLVTDVAFVGDFNTDGLVDGSGFLLWQRGGSPNPLSPADFFDWQANYGARTASNLSLSNVVPEPSSLILILAELSWLIFRSR